MHHPIFAKFEILTSNAVPPEFHYDFLGEVRRKAFDDGINTVLGLQTISYAPDKLRRGDYPAFNEEYFEWVDVLETAIEATQSFTVIELGAGYGRWLVRAALAARQYHGGHLPIKLVGVEAEPTHFQWLKQHLRDNDIDPDDHELIEAAVDEHDGEVFFHVGKADEWYGQAIAQNTDQESAAVRRVRAVSLNRILSPLNSVDLIDLDVQGSEFVVLRSAIAALNEKVKRVHIGTHGHDVELQLRQLFRQNGWYKLNDYSCQSTEVTPWGSIAFGDGVQTWVNPRLSPVSPTAEALNQLQQVLATSEAREARLQLSLESLQQVRPESNSAATQAEVAHLRAVIAAMESSKFWQLRTAWFNLKQALSGKKPS